MIFTKALFYPAIDIENEDWLKNAIFFWDEINTIVPSSICNPYIGETARYLAEEGILHAIRLNPDSDFIENLTTDILNYINTNEGFQLLTQGQGLHMVLHRDKLPKEISNLFNLHPEKLRYEIQCQFCNNLSREFWFRINSDLIIFYITLLANKISEQKSIALLTDNPLSSNLTDKIRLDNQISIKGGDYNFNHNPKNEKCINLTGGLLTNLTIKNIRITKQSSITDILNFKKKYRDELDLYRSSIAKFTNDVTKDTTLEILKQQIEHIYNEDFLPSCNNLKKALNSSGIKWVTENFMKVSIISTCPTALPSALGGLALPQALFVRDEISLITSLTSYNVDKKFRLRTNQYSYLMKLNNHVSA